MNGRLPVSWDHVGFAEFAATVRSACAPDLSAPLIEVIERSSARWEQAQRDTSQAIRPPQFHRDFHSRVKSSLMRHYSITLKQLRIEMAGSDWREIAVLSSFLGALPGLQSLGEPSIPGWYDREIELIASEARSSVEASTPISWDVVCKVLQLAREALMTQFIAPIVIDDEEASTRFLTIQSSFLGNTYAPVAWEISERLLVTAAFEHKTLTEPLDDFLESITQLQRHWLQALGRLVQTAVHRAGTGTALSRSAGLTEVMSHLSPAEVLRELSLGADLAQAPAIIELTLGTSDGNNGSLRDQPLVRGRDANYLVLPRRVMTDLHDTLDRAITRLLTTDSSQLGRYPDRRAESLDRVIAKSVEALLPGAQVLTGNTWLIDGVTYERDVVVLYQDVAICIETKAPRLDPFPRAGRRDVVKVLRDDVAQGVKQASLIADSLELGVARNTLTGAAPKVRRAYRLVATFNPWWGVDTNAHALAKMHVFPQLDSALLTSADKFVCFEKLFNEPADFVAYLDHRLSYQRRDTVRVSDEYELIGSFFCNLDLAWSHRRPSHMQTVMKPVFQADVTRAVIASYKGLNRGRLEGDQTALFSAQLDHLRINKPASWLVAYSALARCPSFIRSWVVDQAFQFTANPRRPRLKTVKIGRDECTLMLVESVDHLGTNDHGNFIRAASSSSFAFVLETTTGRFQAVRGLDDDNFWFSEELLVRPTRT
jgi:hypothetical protein